MRNLPVREFFNVVYSNLDKPIQANLFILLKNMFENTSILFMSKDDNMLAIGLVETLCQIACYIITPYMIVVLNVKQ